MGIFDEFNKKEKPVFTGLKFGFGSGGAAGPSGPGISATGGLTAVGTSKKFHVFLQPSGVQNFIISGGQLTNVEVLMLAGGGGGGGGDGNDNINCFRWW